MNPRKLAMLGIFSLIGVLSFDTDSQACHRKKKSSGCHTTCAAPASCNACGGGIAYAAMPTGGITSDVPTPAFGTPAGGTVTSGEYVVPASYSVPATTAAPRRGLFRR